MASVYKIHDGFPHQAVEAIVGEPTFDTINGLARILKTNAASIPSTNGGGNLGHLGLMVSATVYAVLAPGTPFATPVNPGAYFVPTATTGPTITAEERVWDDSQMIYKLYHNTDKALKKQLLGAIEDIYIRPLKHRHTGYAQVTSLHIITHLFDNYGRITAHDLDENEKRFKTAWSPSQPLEHLVEQIEDAVDYAESGGSPFTDRQVVTNSYNLVFATGIFPEACREWRRRASNTKTWDNFKIDFTAAHNDYREMQSTTTTGTGYHQAHSSILEEFVHDTTLSFANLATATQADRVVIQQLTTTNASLTSQVSAQTIEIARLNKLLAQRRTTRPPPTTPPGPPAGAGVGTDPAKKKFPNLNYCWSHGFDCAQPHESPSCLYKLQGHQDAATRENNLGGSQANKHKVL